MRWSFIEYLRHIFRLHKEVDCAHQTTLFLSKWWPYLLPVVEKMHLGESGDKESTSLCKKQQTYRLCFVNW